RRHAPVQEDHHPQREHDAKAQRADRGLVVGLPFQTDGVRRTSSTSSPYLRNFESPTPGTRRSSARVAGRAAAIAVSVVSWNTTKAGTPVARAVPRRHRVAARGREFDDWILPRTLAGEPSSHQFGEELPDPLIAPSLQRAVEWQLLDPRLPSRPSCPPAAEYPGYVGKPDSPAETCDCCEPGPNRVEWHRFFGGL